MIIFWVVVCLVLKLFTLQLSIVSSVYQMSDEELFNQHELEERRIRQANSELAVQRARQKLRDAELAERNGSSIFPMPTTLKSIIESREGSVSTVPSGYFIDDSHPNQHSASIYEGTPAQRAWYELLSRMSPPANRSSSQSYSTSQIGETGTFSIGTIRETRRIRGGRW